MAGIRSFLSRRLWVWLMLGLAGLSVAAVALVFGLDTPSGQRWLTKQIAQHPLKSGLKIDIGPIEGSLLHKAFVKRVVLSDREGPFLVFKDIRFDWQPKALLDKKIDIRFLNSRDVFWLRSPRLASTSSSSWPDWHFDMPHIGIDRLHIMHTNAHPMVRVQGSARLRKGQVRLALSVAGIGTADHAQGRMAFSAQDNVLDMALRVSLVRDGVLAHTLGFAPGVEAILRGTGNYTQWQGLFTAQIAGAPLAKAVLSTQKGTMHVEGDVFAHKDLSPMWRSVLGSLSHLQAWVQLEPALSARLTLSDPKGPLLAHGAFRRAQSGALLGSAILRDPQGLLVPILASDPNASGRDIEGSVLLTGTQSQPHIDVRLMMGTLARGAQRIEGVRARAQGGVYQSIAVQMGAKQWLTGIHGLDQSSPELNGTISYKPRADRLDADMLLKANASDVRVPMMIKAVVTGIKERHYKATMQINPLTRDMPTPWRALFGTAPLLSVALDYSAPQNFMVSKLVLQTAAATVSGSGRITPKGVSAQAQGSVAPTAWQIWAPDVRSTKPIALGLQASGSLQAPSIVASVRAAHISAGPVVARDLALHAQSDGLSAWMLSLSGETTLGTLQAQAQWADQATIQGHLGSLSIMGTLNTALSSGDMRMVLTSAAGPGAMNAELGFRREATGVRLPFVIDAENFNHLYQNQPVKIGKLHAVGAMRVGKEFSIEARGDTVQWGQAALEALTLSGGGPLKDLRFAYTISGTRGVPFSGSGMVTAQGGADLNALTLSFSGMAAQQSLVLAKPLMLVRTGAQWRLLPTQLALGNGALTATGIWQNGNGSVDVGVEAVRVEALRFILPSLGLAGRADGQGTLVFKDGSLATGQGILMLKRIHRTRLLQANLPLDFAVRVNSDSKTMVIDARAAVNTQEVGTFMVHLTPEGQGFGAARIDGRVFWNGPAEALTGLINADTHDLRGPLMIDARLGGYLNDPDLSGSVKMRDGRYENLALGLTATRLAVAAQFTGSKITLDTATASLNSGGTLSATGAADLSAARGFPMKMQVRLNKAALIKRDELDVVASGVLDVQFGQAGGKISGPLVLDRMRLVVGNNQKAVADIPQLAYRERNVEASNFAFPQPDAAPWVLDISVRAPDHIFVNGFGLISEWGGSVSVVGTATAPALSGRLKVLRGTYEFAGRRFAIDRGTVNFDPKDPLNPVLNIDTSTRINDTTGIVSLQGTPQKPRISFSSIPQLPEDEVLARVLFGTSIAQLSPLEGAQLAGAIAQLSQGGARKLNVLGQLSHLTRIDRLRILPANEQIGSSTAISGGKYIGERLYLEVATDGRGYTATNIEVILTRTLSILSQIATLGGTNVNIKWSKDY